MNKETRIKEIQVIIDSNETVGNIPIPWKDELESRDAYKFPLELLVYNKYNGRILSRTKSNERQDKKIDAESAEGKKLIEKLLYESKPKKNDQTLKSLKTLGQEKFGIITKDGIIIDGNRRAMLLNKIDHIDYFKAVVLPIEYEGDALEIEKFETKYQLGEERKLDYNPIEIYLKIQRLYQQISKQNRYPTKSDLEDGIKVHEGAISQIYQWIGNYKTIGSKKDIEYSLQVINTMDEYLDYLEYNGIYTALDDREEQFRDLTTWLNNFYGETSVKPFPMYSDNDVDDLKTLCFELVRIKLKNEKFRFVGRGQRPNHFFGNKEIWGSFMNKHFSLSESYKELPLDFGSSNIEAHLNSRDSDFRTKIGEQIVFNVDSHYSKLRNKQAQDKPKQLLDKAYDSVDSINTNSKQFSSPEIQSLTERLIRKTIGILINKSPTKVLSIIIELLEQIKVKNIKKEEVEEVKKGCKRIQQLGYQLTKKL